MATDVRFVIDELSRYNNPQLGAPFAGHLGISISAGLARSGIRLVE
jgi:hypothetical protein